MQFAPHLDAFEGGEAHQDVGVLGAHGGIGLGGVFRLPGLRGLLVVGMSSGKFCAFQNIYVHNGAARKCIVSEPTQLQMVAIRTGLTLSDYFEILSDIGGSV